MSFATLHELRWYLTALLYTREKLRNHWTLPNSKAPDWHLTTFLPRSALDVASGVCDLEHYAIHHGHWSLDPYRLHRKKTLKLKKYPYEILVYPCLLIPAVSLCCIYKSKCKFSRKLPPGEIGLGGEDVNWGFEASQLNVKVSPLGSLADVLPPPVAAVNVLRRRASPVTFIFWKVQEKTALSAVDGIVWFSTFSLHCGSNIQTTQPPPSVNFVFYRMVFLTVPPNFQYQNEKWWAANQRFCSMKFSMYKRSSLVEQRFSF